MLAGSLSERITIETRTKTEDSFGTPSSTWTTLKEVSAKVTQNPGQKIFNNNPDHLYHSYNTRFEFRYLSGFNYDCRIKYEGDYYTIQSIEKLRRNIGFVVIAERNTNDGY